MVGYGWRAGQMDRGSGRKKMMMRFGWTGRREQ